MDESKLAVGPGSDRPSRISGLRRRVDVGVLRESFEWFLECEPGLGHRFFATLFGLHPETRRAFTPYSRSERDSLLLESLEAMLTSLEHGKAGNRDLPALFAVLEVGDGVAEMQGWVSEALLTTLAQVARFAWTEELSATWREAISIWAAPPPSREHAR